MKTKRMYIKILYVFFALLLLSAAVFGGRGIMPAFAATGYTSALEDLQKDESFNLSDYPDNSDDHSISVIQIAESTDKELFVYTYQPCQKTTYLVATNLNMSLSESVDGTKLYPLTLVSCNGVLCKYKVNDLTVSDDKIRYYNITSIYREWIKGVDGETGNDNIKNGVAFAVGKLYKAETEDGAIIYSNVSTEVVQILNPVAGKLRYSNGFKLYKSACDSHYVAFSTDKKIDTLMEADISFYTQNRMVVSKDMPYGDREYHELSLNGEEKGGSAADGFLSKKYEWNRIESINEFLNDSQNEFTDEAKTKLDGAQWVLRFLETDFRVVGGMAGTTTYYTSAEEVSILRLKFVTDGKVYNLGAVSDTVTEGNKPDNTNTNEYAGLFEWLERVTGIPKWVWILILALIILAPLLGILAALIPPFGRFLLVVLKYVGIGLWWLICLPFKGIAALIRKIKDKKDGG